MTAAAADRQIEMRPRAEEHDLEVKTATEIFLGTIVCAGADGYAVPGADTAGLRVKGFALEHVNNAGASGAKTVRVRRMGWIKMIGTGLAKTDEGQPCWLTDDQTIKTTPGKVFAGRIELVESATAAWVDITPAVLGPVGEIFALHAFSAGAVGDSLVTVRSGIKIPRPFMLLRGYVDAKTAPGGAYNCAAIFTDGTTPKTVTLTGAAVHAEDEAINQVYPAETDCSMTLQDDDASGSTADVNVEWMCQYL